MYELFLTLVYLYKRRIVYFAVAAVVLCTMMVVIVNSVMGGFLEKIKLKARGLLGDVIVQNSSVRGFPLYDEFITEIRTWPEIQAATPVAFGVGVLNFKGTTVTELVRISGIRLDEISEVNDFSKSLFYDKFYPGTVSFGPQRQPELGFDPEISPRRKDNQEMMLAALPEEFRAALARSLAAGLVDKESRETEYNELLREAGQPAAPGYFALTTMPAEEDVLPPPPQMAGDPWPGLIVGRDLIAERMRDGRYDRRLPRGQLAVITVVAVTDNGMVETPTKQAFRYTDDSRTGIYEIDKQTVYCDFALLQRLMQLDEAERTDGTGKIRARCSQIQIKLRPGADGNAVADRLQARYAEMVDDPKYDLTSYESRLADSVRAMTWVQSQAHFIMPVEKEKVLVTILFAIISLVAAVLVLCILYMIVLQKTRDIGIIKALGGSSGGVASVFLLYGVAVGVVGSAIGGTLGYLIVININSIQDWLISIHPSLQVWDRTVYSFDEIPNTVDMKEFAFILACGVGLAVIGSVAAAVRAARMHPVEALRYE